MQNLATRKYSIIEKVMHLSEEELAELELWLIGDENEISVDQYNRHLEKADSEIEQGTFYTHQEAIERLNSWKKTTG